MRGIVAAAARGCTDCAVATSRANARHAQLHSPITDHVLDPMTSTIFWGFPCSLCHGSPPPPPPAAVLHLIQLVFSDCFRLYDYGSGAANRAHYGVSQPPDVSAEYWRLDMPVHLVAGRRDGIIPPANIRRHLDAMRAQVGWSSSRGGLPQRR